MIKEYITKSHGNWFGCDNGKIEIQITVKNEFAHNMFMHIWNTEYENKFPNLIADYRDATTMTIKDKNFDGVFCSHDIKYMSNIIEKLNHIDKKKQISYLDRYINALNKLNKLTNKNEFKG